MEYDYGTGYDAKTINTLVIAKFDNGEEIEVYTNLLGHGKVFENSFGVYGTEFLDFDCRHIEVEDENSFEPLKEEDWAKINGCKIVDIVKILGDIEWEL